MNKIRKVISLNGDWDFAYTKNLPDLENTVFPADKDYETKIQVPAYWDDCKDKLKYTKFWSRNCVFNPEYRQIEFPMGSSKPADASLPYLLGTGWYKKRFFAPKDLKNKAVTLNIGGVTMEAWIWINGKFIHHHIGHLTPFEVNISNNLILENKNEILIAVSNIRNDRKGCSIRGYKGRSGGITRSVSIQVSKKARIKELYIRTQKDLKELIWETTIDYLPAVYKNLDITWEIEDKLMKKTIAKGTVKACENINIWNTDTSGMKKWSDKEPYLYNMKITLSDGENLLDELEQSFGLRNVYAKENKIFLNNERIILRGVTEHAYFPETCTVPVNTEYYQKAIKSLKAAGYNWIRFHTWTPPEECLDTADKLGMLIQVEAPNGFDDTDFLNIIHTCRKHPSVIIYCCGNEVPFKGNLNEKLMKMSDYTHKLVPDTLFNPMEALRKIEFDADKNADGYTENPVPHNTKMLDEVRRYSDVIAPAVWVFSYNSLETDMKKIDDRLAIYKKPCLIHEAGINDSYLNLDLEKRYEGTRIGTDLFTSARKYLTEMGVIKNAPVYYQNSCKWMRQVIKFSLEKARHLEKIAGYDFLGGIDCHWHRSGYAVGIFNEFYELKHGFTFEDMQEFNGENILLSDTALQRSLISGEKLNVKLQLSLYGKYDIEKATLIWYFEDENKNIYSKGQKEIEKITKGGISDLAEISLNVPQIEQAGRHLLLKVRLSGEAYELTNKWDYWVFNNKIAKEEKQSSEVKVVNDLTIEDIEYINQGGKIILLGTAGLPSINTSFQIMSGGRTAGHNATVIYDHPLMRNFPHEGFCDLQFSSMLENGQAIVFNDLEIEFSPIIEMVSTYKLIKKQAGIFEIKVGKGGLLVNTLNMENKTPASIALYNIMLDYISSEEFAPKQKITAQKLKKILNKNNKINSDFENDECYDDGNLIEQ